MFRLADMIEFRQVAEICREAERLIFCILRVAIIAGAIRHHGLDFRPLPEVLSFLVFLVCCSYINPSDDSL